MRKKVPAVSKGKQRGRDKTVVNKIINNPFQVLELLTVVLSKLQIK